MKSKIYYFLIALLLYTSSLHAQLGIRVGLNTASEIKKFDQQAISDGFNSKNLTGYQIGLVYQAMPKQSGIGCEIGALLTQKGSSYTDSTDVNSFKEGYTELNYLEVPFNVRYRLNLGLVGIYGIAGIYGGYALNGKVVQENPVVPEAFSSFMDHVDYGYNLGAGIELFKKIQFGATWSQGLKNTANSSTSLPVPKTVLNRAFTVNLAYMF